jgi:hypothetical protein
MRTRSSLFVNARQPRLAAALALSAAVCALLSACVGNPFADAKVDPRSPIAAEVPKSVRPNAPYPTFAGIPPVPKDVRPHKQYGQAAAKAEQDGSDVVGATAPNTWTLDGTDTFAAQARTDAGPVPPPVQPGDTEAFARDQKARATSPPPPPR